MKHKILALVSLAVSLAVLVTSFFYLMHRAANDLPLGMVAAIMFASALIVMLCVGNVYNVFKSESDSDEE